MVRTMENLTKKGYEILEDCERFTAELIEMTWRDLYWVVEIIRNGVTIRESEVKIITINTEGVAISRGVFVKFEMVRLSAPEGTKYLVRICDDEMEIETIKSN